VPRIELLTRVLEAMMCRYVDELKCACLSWYDVSDQIVRDTS